MQRLIFPLIFLVSLTAFSQKMHDEFMPTFIGDKEAFLSSKTGEFVFREHNKTNVSALYTTESGTVIYEDRKTHAVKKGESLSSIAKKHGVAVSEIKEQNTLKSNILSVGQQIKVAIKYVVPSSKPVINKPEGKIIARLAPGQTPGGMTPPDLPPDAMPGSTINLVVEDGKKPTVNQKVDTTATKTEAITNNINDDGTINHIVKSGETLFTIARKYKVSISDLKETNGLALNTISKGQKLKVKVYNPAVFKQNQQIVQVEETKPEPKIVEKVENAVVEKPKEIKAKVEVVEEEAKKEAVQAKSSRSKVVVEKVEEKATTDTSGSIEKSSKEKVVEEKPIAATSDTAKKPSKEEIEEDKKEEKINGLIKKYAKKDTSKVHVVKKGETLWAISKKYNMTVTNLIELNSLKTNFLKVGQELKVK